MINKLRNVVLNFVAIMPMISISTELPDGYFSVEYIEATGTQYIDTGMVASNKRCAKGVFSFPTFPAENEWWGILSASDDAEESAGVTNLYCYSLLGVMHYNSSQAQLVVSGFLSPYGVGKRCSIDSFDDRYYCAASYFRKDYRGYFCTNLTTKTGNGYNSNAANTRSLDSRNFYLFANNNKGIPTNFAKARLYSLSFNGINDIYFKDEGTPLRNYVPAYRAADGVYGVYDTVTGEFKKSEGSEPFLGPAVIDIGDFDENGYDCQFTGCAPGVSKPEIGMKIVISRRSGAVRHYGAVANGVTNMLDDAAFEYEVTAENVNSSFRVVPCVDNNWYVCNDTGSDSNSGFLRTTPKKTLAAILTVATNAGDVVHAAAGTYASGEIEYDQEAYKNKYNDASFGSDPVRCEIASNVRLVGDAGAEATILDGSGTHRGVLLNPGAVIQGFTIRNCKATYFGSAVYGFNDNDVVADCILSNNDSLRYTAYNVKAVFRSRFYSNRATSVPVGSGINLYNCLIGEGHSGDYCLYQRCYIYNCTIVGMLAASCKWVRLMNCLVVPNGRKSSDKCYWWNSSYVGDQNSADVFYENCKQVSTDEMQFVDSVDAVPVIGANYGIDRGDYGLYLTNYPSALDPLPNGINCDLLGRPRVSNGTIDQGCVEADWRGLYAEKIGSFFAVESASSNVVSTLSSESVRLYPGESLSGVLRPNVKKTFFFTVSGTGVLTVNVDGVIHEFSGEGGKSLFVNGGRNVLFSYDGNDGFADILRSQGGGLLITVK